MWTHPLDVLAKGLAEAGAEDLELDVRVGAVVLEVHQPRQARDVALKEGADEDGSESRSDKNVPLPLRVLGDPLRDTSVEKRALADSVKLY